MEKTEIIQAKYGKVQGYIEEGISIFKGIPYAEPPVGDLRLNAPILKKYWDGTLEALKYRPVAPQPPPYNPIFPPPPQDEADCLNLNIWTPGCDNKKRPVLFWIHGGSHIYGSGNLLNGRALSRRGDVVLVSINYRLGALGYLYFPGTPSNIGQLDQITALEWVRDNIEHFGGDPENVTIFGESAGATSVCTLMAMPQARDLFRRAVSQSGAVTPEGFEISVKKTTTELILKELGLDFKDLAEFRSLSTETIINAMIKAQEKAFVTQTSMDFRPWVDSENLPKHPTKAIYDGYAKDIELIVGSNLEEWKFWRAFEPEFEEYDQSEYMRRIEGIVKSTGEDEKKVEDIIKMYQKSREENKLSINLAEIYEACMSDSIFRIPSIKFAEAQSKHQKNTYMYLFNWKTPFENGRYGAMHALEISFVFGSFWEDYLFTFPKRTPETEKLSNYMSDYWISFARIGNPNFDGLLNWPVYDKESRKTMVFDNNIEIVEDPLNLEREMWYNLKPWSEF
ncbi:MAG: carboxylesterase/lipase family protein [Promethearchaeota archaeon]